MLGQTIEVPSDMAEIFAIVSHALHPDTPIRKTTTFSKDGSYPTMHGSIVPADSSIVDAVEVPLACARAWGTLSSPRYRNPEDIAAAHAKLKSQRVDGYAQIGFAEQHIIGEGRKYYEGLGISDLDAWQLGVETRVQGQQGGLTVSKFAINSWDETAGLVITWSGGRGETPTTEPLRRDPERFAEITRTAADMLIPYPEIA